MSLTWILLENDFIGIRFWKLIQFHRICTWMQLVWSFFISNIFRSVCWLFIGNRMKLTEFSFIFFLIIMNRNEPKVHGTTPIQSIDLWPAPFFSSIFSFEIPFFFSGVSLYDVSIFQPWPLSASITGCVSVCVCVCFFSPFLLPFLLGSAGYGKRGFFLFFCVLSSS